MAAYISFQPSDFFNTILYTGDGSTTQAQTGVGFAPDMVWLKCTSGAESHVLGTTPQGGNAYLIPNSTAVEGSLTNYLKSFDSDGFSVGSEEVANQCEDYTLLENCMDSDNCGWTTSMSPNGNYCRDKYNINSID